jgi:uncharacterized protein YdiU (UPF0061 family)
MQIAFENSYARLPERFYARLAPTPVRAPRLLRLNDALAAELGLDAASLRSEAGVAILAGNAVPEGAEPLAQAYAGHQFGGWVPQLGDGRAILLGEVVGAHGRRDIQLKGSGRTPFSRSGDGRAWIGPVLREYIVSEAMHALGIPTTRALAAVATGEPVLREAALPGAVLTRVAQSHIRVGTFQYFLARNDAEALATLAEHAIRRHYPDATGPLDLLRGVVAAQARLVAAWMSVGFIHGVMNTDNTSIAGETIDYGPCAFMDRYHPDTVFSSIDRWGRYAYAQQPQVAAWNLAQFATALLPLMGDGDAAVEAATEAVHGFAPAYQAAWARRFGAKLGLADPGADDAALAHDLLDIMAARGDDFTRTFRDLSEGVEMPDDYAAWQAAWEGRGPDRALMRRTNPAVIPRNHRVEEAIGAALADDLDPFHALVDTTARPFDVSRDHPLAAPPPPGAEVTRTFCGT